jgi:hypothetical protein
MQAFMLGMISMGFAVAALLFLRFWRSSRDRLFLFFAAAFVIEAVNRGVFAAIGTSGTEYQLGYVLARLVSFALILIGILQKNLSRRP